MRHRGIMSESYVFCAPTSHLCEVEARLGRQTRYAVVMEDGDPIGVIPRSTILDLDAVDRGDPTCTAERELLAIACCSEEDSLGYIGAKILRERAHAALLFRGETLVGVAALLDILQAMLWASTETSSFNADLLGQS